MKRISIGLATCCIALGALCRGTRAFHLFQHRPGVLERRRHGPVRRASASRPAANGENFWAGHRLADDRRRLAPNSIPCFRRTCRRRRRRAAACWSRRAASRRWRSSRPITRCPTASFPRGGGTLNYAGGVDQVALPALPTDGATAVDRNGHPVAATPKNFAGATATLTLPPPTATAPRSQSARAHRIVVRAGHERPGHRTRGLSQSRRAGHRARPGRVVHVRQRPRRRRRPRALVHVQRQRPERRGQRPRHDLPERRRQFQRAADHAGDARSARARSHLPTAATRTLTYTFTDGSGRNGSIPLTRLTPNVTCTVGTAPPTNADFALSGNWFAPATAGQGFVFDVNPVSPAVFLTWYTYAPTGQMLGAAGQRWFVGLLNGLRGRKPVRSRCTLVRNDGRRVRPGRPTPAPAVGAGRDRDRDVRELHVGASAIQLHRRKQRRSGRARSH